LGQLQQRARVQRLVEPESAAAGQIDGRQKLGTFVSRENLGDLMVLKELIEAGKVTPVVDRAYPLSEVPDAMRYMREGRARGKLVITV